MFGSRLQSVVDDNDDSFNQNSFAVVWVHERMNKSRVAIEIYRASVPEGHEW